MIQGVEKYLPLLKTSLLSFLSDEDQTKILGIADIFSSDRGHRVPREEVPGYLYFLLEGETSIRYKTGVDYARGRPGRSFELRTLLMQEKAWQYDWVCESPSVFVRFPWVEFIRLLAKNERALQYLIRISQSVPLQRLKRDLVALGLTRDAVVEIISSLHLEEVDNLFTDWNRKVFFTLATGEVMASVRFNDRKHKVAFLQIGDTSYFDLRTTNLTYEADEGSKAWALFENEWLKFKYKDEFQKFLDVFAVHSGNVVADDQTQATAIRDLRRAQEATNAKTTVYMSSSNFWSRIVWWKVRLFKPKIYGSRDENRTTSAVLVSVGKYFGVKLGQQRVERKIQGLMSNHSIVGLEAAAKLLGFKATLENYAEPPVDSNCWPCILPLDSGFRILFGRSETQALIGDPETGEVVMVNAERLRERMIEERVLVMKKTPSLKARKDPGIPYHEYVKILMKNPYLILLYFIGGFLYFFFDLAIPVLNQYLFDVVIANKDAKLFLPAIGAVMALTVCSNLLLAFNQGLGVDLSTSFSARLRSLFQSRLFKLPIHYVRTLGTSGIMTRYQDVDQVGAFFVNGLLGSFLGIFLMAGSLSVLWLYHKELVYLAVVFIPLEIFLIQLLRQRLEDNRLELAQLKARENRLIVEHFTSSDDMKTLKGQLTARWKWQITAHQGARNLGRAGILTASFQLFHFLFGELVKIVCFLAAVRFYLKGEMTLGQVVGTSLLVPKVSQPFQSMVATYFQFFSIRPVLQRINDMVHGPLELPEEDEEILASPQPFRGDIRFRNVSFSYDVTSHRRVLSNISFHIKPGEKVAFVGPCGCGKSSIANLLNGLYQPTSGTIQFDGTSINDIELGRIRDQVGVVEQEGDLFAGTIQENIAWGDSTPEVDRVQAAARMAELEDEILAKPGGYSAPLNHGGAGISEGQKQRLLIARALYKKPSIIVLDEATSHLDPISEERVIERLMTHFEKSTVIFFTQRVHLTVKADRIFYIEDGKLMEQGSHKELIENKSKYYEFFILHLSLG